MSHFFTVTAPDGYRATLKIDANGIDKDAETEYLSYFQEHLRQAYSVIWNLQKSEVKTQAEAA